MKKIRNILIPILLAFICLTFIQIPLKRGDLRRGQRMPPGLLIQEERLIHAGFIIHAAFMIRVALTTPPEKRINRNHRRY
ncbi:hypothetical protein L0152_29595 [bacterium]|nr:hypothetical protein [bacterium]